MMDTITTPTPTPPTTTTIPKSPEPESETPTRIQPAKPISFSNGIIKRHHHNHHHIFTFKECLKNHAASLGGHALDGCGEFMPSPSSISTDPTSLKCAACGCHRNFHRREPDHNNNNSTSTISAAIEYQPHHRHQPLPPPSPPSSPPPISSSYMLLSLSGTNNNNLAFSDLNFNNHNPPNNQIGSRKRFRTKFTQFQKEKMHEFADRVNWKMQKRDEDDVRQFCNQIGVDKSVLKVWMHNNKNTFNNRRDPPFSVAGTTEIRKTESLPIPNGGGHSVSSGGGGGGGGGFDSDSGGAHGCVNGSSSS
ncbi:hypothetical protein AALP_AA8G308300 [Arabis alpina]|uniref:ZF-HD dimerization-type domain-containing protein n=1 Tax=Arabis alpina TaxID=50452 RepID=A0A087GAK0_ARAAL|nr:hypothetical protein AALP_AA8G308300 [Arabis alpina]